MQELVPLLEKLAEKMGTTSTHLWEVLVKQAKISAITDLVWLIVYIPFFIMMSYITIKKYGGWYETACKSEAEVPFVIAISVIFMIAIIMVIVTLCCIPGIINGFYNPEYWALDNIMSQLARLKK